MKIKKLSFSAMFLALCLLLPFLTGQIPQIGSMLSPMHIPVLLCGFVCGPLYAMVVGFIAPILRSVVFGMPPMFPTASAMAFELAAYGAFAGIFYKALPKTNINVYIALVLSMFLGRLVWGAVMFLFAALFSIGFTFQTFVAGAFVTAVPGIILHVVLIPPVVMLLRKEKLIINE
ncbi:MAG: ECF transporter S component [Lachnospiraceae bacterium]|nr:ECF transporter S component [Lachnospiraceae bacterium]